MLGSVRSNEREGMNEKTPLFEGGSVVTWSPRPFLSSDMLLLCMTQCCPCLGRGHVLLSRNPLHKVRTMTLSSLDLRPSELCVTPSPSSSPLCLLSSSFASLFQPLLWLPQKSCSPLTLGFDSG